MKAANLKRLSASQPQNPNMLGAGLIR